MTRFFVGLPCFLQAVNCGAVTAARCGAGVSARETAVAAVLAAKTTPSNCEGGRAAGEEDTTSILVITANATVAGNDANKDIATSRLGVVVVLPRTIKKNRNGSDTTLSKT